MMKNKNLSNKLKMLIQGLPLAAIVGAAMLPLQNTVRQLLILAVLLWFQVFMIQWLTKNE